MPSANNVGRGVWGWPTFPVAQPRLGRFLSLTGSFHRAIYSFGGPKVSQPGVTYEKISDLGTPPHYLLWCSYIILSARKVCFLFSPSHSFVVQLFNFRKMRNWIVLLLLFALVATVLARPSRLEKPLKRRGAAPSAAAPPPAIIKVIATPPAPPPAAAKKVRKVRKANA
jgi:hypothetical protein